MEAASQFWMWYKNWGQFTEFAKHFTKNSSQRVGFDDSLDQFSA